MLGSIEWIIAKQHVAKKLDRNRDLAVISALFVNKDNPDTITPLELWEGRVREIPAEYKQRRPYDWIMRDTEIGRVFLFEVVGTEEDVKVGTELAIKKIQGAFDEYNKNNK